MIKRILLMAGAILFADVVQAAQDPMIELYTKIRELSAQTYQRDTIRLLDPETNEPLFSLASLVGEAEKKPSENKAKKQDNKNRCNIL